MKLRYLYIVLFVLILLMIRDPKRTTASITAGTNAAIDVTDVGVNTAFGPPAVTTATKKKKG